MKKIFTLAIILIWVIQFNLVKAQTISISQVDTFAIKGLPDQPILKININTAAAGLTLERLVINSLSDDSADISRVKIYRTSENRFSLADYAGEATLISPDVVKLLKDSAVFEGLTYPLGAGNNYLWVVFDLSPGSAAGNILDASIRAGGITISGIKYPSSLQSPLGTVQIRQRYFTSNFEQVKPDNTPTGWTVVGESQAKWICTKGGHEHNPDSTKSGYYNVRSYAENKTGRVSRLISPALNLSIGTKLKLTFYHAQPYRVSSSASDSLGLYYGFTPTGPWYFIKNYTTPTPNYEWIKREVDLPDNMLSNKVYLVFKSTAQYGFGVCIDSVTIYESNVSARSVKYIIADHPVTNVVAQGSFNNPILRFDVGVKGNTGTLNFTSLTAKSANTSDGDISSGGVKLYYTNDSVFSSPILIGSGTFSGNQVTISGFTRKLSGGKNYFWITYDIPTGANPNDILDLTIPAGGIVISDGGTYPESELSPDGNKIVKQTIFYDDFETNKGWILTGDFERNIPVGKGTAKYGFPDPGKAYSLSHVLGNDLSVDGDYAKNSRNLATTPLLSAKYYKNTRLSYARWLNVENIDSAVIEYQYAGDTKWITYWKTGSTVSDGAWSLLSASTSNIFDRQKFKIRYRLGTTNDLIESSGWNIDCFFLTGDSIKYDAAITKFIGPLSACGLTSNENVTVRVKNTGPHTLSNIPIKLSIDGGENWITQTIPGPLAIDDSITYSFSSVNLSKPAIYNIIVKVNYPLDDYNNNDSVVYQLTSVPTYKVPYHTGFEMDTTFWMAGGLNSSWQKGEPYGAEIVYAFEGKDCWKTNQYPGFFNLYENSYVMSPCFDLSGVDVPLVDFQAWYNTLIKETGARMEYSVDGGTNWSIVTKDSYNFNWKWYNDSIYAFHDKTKGWTDRSIDNALNTAWLQNKQTLPGATANQNLVRLRYHFKADSSVKQIYSGFAFDDFKILNAPYDAGVVSIDNLSSPACQYSNPDKLQLTVKNFGIRKIRQNDSIVLGIQVNQNPVVIDTFKLTSDININNTRQVTMTKPVDMKEPGDYKIRAFVIEKYPGYYNTNNDTFKLDVTVYPNPLTSLPDTIYTANKDTLVIKTITDPKYLYSWKFGGSEKSTTSQINVGPTGFGSYYLKVENKDSHCVTKDSVVVKELIPDIGIEGILSPISNCGTKNLVSPTIRVHNYGTDTMRVNQKIPVNIKLNRESIIKDTIRLMTRFNPNTSFDVTLSSVGLNLTTPKMDTLKIWTALSTDHENSNDTTTKVFEIYGYPTVFLGKDTTINGKLTHELDAGAGWSTYAWSDGVTTTRKCTITKPGKYSVTITDAKGCPASDTINVRMVIHDLTMQKLVTPINACGATASTSIRCQIKNTGTDTIQTSEPLILSYQINGGTIQKDTINPVTMIKPNDSIQYTFKTSADLSTPANYLFKLKMLLAGDIQPLNDTLMQPVQIYGYPTVSLGTNRIVNAMDYNLYPGKYAQYKWQDNSTDSSWHITKTKYQSDNTYSVTVTDEHGCSASNEVLLFLVIYDLEVTDVLLPRSDCKGSDKQIVNIRLTNKGNTKIDKEPVELSYSLNGASPVIENLIFEGGVDANMTKTFELPVDMSAKGNYSFKVKLQMNGDVNPQNDTATFLTKILGYPQVNLGTLNDTLLVKLPYTIQATPGYAKYIWQDNSTNSSFIVKKEDYDPAHNLYNVAVYDENSCNVYKEVRVIEALYDLGITGINQSSNCTKTSTEKLKVQIKNNGTANLVNQNATISYTADGGSPVSQTMNVNLAKGNSQTVDFTDNMDLSAVGTHNIVVTLTYDGDDNPVNNSATYQIQVYGKPAINFGGAGDTILTSSLPVTIDAGGGFQTYVWGDNSKDRYMSARTEGFYKVTVTDNYNCTGNDSIYVKDVTGIKDLKGLESLSLYPNPVADYLYIEIKLQKKLNLTMDLVSPEGRVFYKKNLSGTDYYREDIDVSVLPKGIYLLRIYSDDSIVIRKVVVR